MFSLKQFFLHILVLFHFIFNGLTLFRNSVSWCSVHCTQLTPLATMIRSLPRQEFKWCILKCYILCPFDSGSIELEILQVGASTNGDQQINVVAGGPGTAGRQQTSKIQAINFRNQDGDSDILFTISIVHSSSPI